MVFPDNTNKTFHVSTLEGDWAIIISGIYKPGIVYTLHNHLTC